MITGYSIDPIRMKLTGGVNPGSVWVWDRKKLPTSTGQDIFSQRSWVSLWTITEKIYT